ncbi:hypothetical protein FE634_15440 [Nocardioides dongxiaopingii]|uniref:hypothetical protein n=1 Tax=Nocardioides sp. S-1144 TaxID=2582905 RepID=UPI00110EAFB4|nr:hypothetical protein [Nocardioides sp. S-1144]QCW51452.1 hypothetical protein FE634_15440 [Nocardioides sp. S-1144]
MNLYVIDAYGLSAVGDLVEPSLLKKALHELTDLVKDGRLRFPDSVWRECCKYLDEHGLGLWAKSVAGHLSTDSSTWAHEDEVLDQASDLVDPDATEYQTQVDVAKIAVWLQSSGHAVEVVTEDVGDRPDRMSLTDACIQLGLATLSTTDFLDAVLSFEYS